MRQGKIDSACSAAKSSKAFKPPYFTMTDKEQHGSKRLTQISGRFQNSTQTRLAERQQLARDSPLKGFPISKNIGSIEQIKQHETAARGIGNAGRAHRAYYAFMHSSQGGIATIASDDHRSLFAVKSVKGSVTDHQSYIKLFQNDHVVSLLDVFQADDRIRIVYELMFVSLRNIASTPRGNLRVFEIQAICKEVRRNLKRSRSTLTNLP